MVDSMSGIGCLEGMISVFGSSVYSLSSILMEIVELIGMMKRSSRIGNAGSPFWSVCPKPSMII